MYFVTHAAAGAAIGRCVSDPAAGLVAGLVSHAVLDLIPHHDYHRTVTGLVDLGLGLLFLLAFGLNRTGPAGEWAILGATIPDLEVALSQFGIITEDDLRFPTHSGLLPHCHAQRVEGAIIQSTLIGLSTLMLS